MDIPFHQNCKPRYKISLLLWIESSIRILADQEVFESWHQQEDEDKGDSVFI